MSLIDFVYPDLNNNLGDPPFFQERGILAPMLDSIEHVNEYMMSVISRSLFWKHISRSNTRLTTGIEFLHIYEEGRFGTFAGRVYKGVWS